MTTFRYFADLPSGETLMFTMVDYRPIDPKKFTTDNIKAFGYNGASKQWVQVTRIVQLKSNPSRHVCDVRCMNATGRTMQCECSCGGKNHGKGAF